MTSVSSIFLKLFVQNYPVVLNFDWNDDNGLVWGQEAYPVANKGEYITEGYALRKSLKGLKYQKQKKRKLNVLKKVYKENQMELEKYTTSVVCVSYEFDLQQKQRK